MHGESARLPYDTKERLARGTLGLATVRFVSLESVRNPTYARRPATAEEAAASAANPNRDPNKEPIKEGEMIGFFGSPSTIYRADVEWADGRREELSVRLRGGEVDGVWIDVIGQPHPRPDATYVMFLRLNEGGYMAIGPQFVLADGTLQPFFDNEPGLGKDFVGDTYDSLKAEFAGAVFENGGQ